MSKEFILLIRQKYKLQKLDLLLPMPLLLPGTKVLPYLWLLFNMSIPNMPMLSMPMPNMPMPNMPTPNMPM